MTIEITDIDELQLIGHSPSYPYSGTYTLMNDIDASATSTWHAGSGFYPIGTTWNRFTGEFYGNGYSINNLTINRPDLDYVGLFGYVDGGIIGDVHVNGQYSGLYYVGGICGCGESSTLTDSSANMSIYGSYYTGGLLGQGIDTVCSGCWARGNIIGINDSVGGFVGQTNGNSSSYVNCYADVDIYGDVSTPSYFGGFVGWADDTFSMYECYALGDINTTGDVVGGFAGGVNGNTATLVKCYGSGDIIGYSYCGGFCGSISSVSILNITCSFGDVLSGGHYIGGHTGYTQNPSTISNSFAHGYTSGNGNIGGFIGHMANSGDLLNCYAAGQVDGTSNVGGLVGGESGGSGPDTIATSCYWDTDTSNQPSSVFGVGKTTSQMKKQNTFIGYDFNNIWYIDEDENYPIFLWMYSAPEVTPVDIVLSYALAAGGDILEPPRKRVDELDPIESFPSVIEGGRGGRVNKHGYVPAAMMYNKSIKDMRDYVEYEKFLCRTVRDDDRTRTFKKNTEEHPDSKYRLIYSNEAVEEHTKTTIEKTSEATLANKGLDDIFNSIIRDASRDHN